MPGDSEHYLRPVTGNWAQISVGLAIHRQEVAAKASRKGEAVARNHARLHDCVLLQPRMPWFSHALHVAAEPYVSCVYFVFV